MASTPRVDSPLERFGHNLTALARQGAFAPLEGQDAVIARIFQILLREKKNNPYLLDFDEARRFTVIAEVVRRMAKGDAPDPLPQRQVIALDMELLFANPLVDAHLYHEHIEQIRLRLLEQRSSLEQEQPERWQQLVEGGLLLPEPGSWATHIIAHERLRTLFAAVSQTKGAAILFVDNFHRIVGAEDGKYGLEMSPVLKPILARCEMQFMATSNFDQYRRHIERDAALQRRFQEVTTREAFEDAAWWWRETYPNAGWIGGPKPQGVQ